MNDKLKMILAAMTPTQARRYKLYLQGMSLTEIAEAEGVSVNSVADSIKRAKRRARRRLSVLGDLNKEGGYPPKSLWGQSVDRVATREFFFQGF